MVVVVFRTRVREGVDEGELERVGVRMYEIASAMPGFISYKEYAAADGEFVAIVEFETAEALAAWRDHPEHKLIQERGRSHYFSDYRVQVCSPLRDYHFTVGGGRVEDAV